MTSLDTTGRLSFQGNQLASKYKERWMSTMTEACYWSKRGKYHILGHTGAPGMDHQVMVLGFMQERIQEWTKVTPAIPLLDIHTEETRIERDTCTPMCITALFIISRTGKQSKCPSADEWIRNLWYIYTMEYYSAVKKNLFESVLMRWMKLEPIIQSEVSQKEKHQYSILTHIYGI